MGYFTRELILTNPENKQRNVQCEMKGFYKTDKQ